jgi:hypothetical protein
MQDPDGKADMFNPYPHTSKEYKILNVIREHYEEGPGTLISHDIRHIARDRTYLAYTVVAFESDDSYRLHAEIVRVDFIPLERMNGNYMKFEVLTDTSLDLTEEI